MRLPIIVLLAAGGLLLATPAAEALTICAGTCPDPPPGPPPGVIEIDPIEIDPLPTIQLLVPAHTDLDFGWGGDLVVRIPVGGASFESLSLNALGDIGVGPDVTLVASADLSLCAGLPACVPDADALSGAGLLGVIVPPQARNVTLRAAGSISVVVPEPRAAILALAGALGLAALGRRRAA